MEGLSFFQLGLVDLARNRNFSYEIKRGLNSLGRPARHFPPEVSAAEMAAAR